MEFEKQLNILDFSLSSLWRRRSKNISVVLVFSAVIFLIASFQMTSQSLTKYAAEALKSSPEIIIQKMSAGRQESLPVLYAEKLSKLFGIRRITPRVWGYYFDELNGANYTVIGVDPKQMPSGSELYSVVNSKMVPQAGEIVIGRGVSLNMKLAGRRMLSLFRPDLSLKPFKIVGEFTGATDYLTNDTMLMTLDDSRDLFAIEADKATDLCVYVANPTEITTIAKKVADLLPDTRVLTKLQINKTYQVVFGWRSGFASVCLVTALFAFFIFAWDKASGLSPEEKKEIGILKVLGWQTADILSMRLWEGVVVSFLAFVIGYTLAFAHVSYFHAILFRPVLVGWSVIFPALTLTPDIVAAELLLVLSLTVLPYLAATVIPAWRAAIIPPDSAVGG